MSRSLGPNEGSFAAHVIAAGRPTLWQGKWEVRVFHDTSGWVISGLRDSAQEAENAAMGIFLVGRQEREALRP